jgi:hypothetical protein
MRLRVLLALLVLTGLAATADAAPRKNKKKTPVSPLPLAEARAVRPPPLDKFLSCDVRVRDYLREGGAAVPVKKIELDDARLQLTVHHEYGEAGKSSRRFLRGESEEEMRKNLYAILDEFRAAQSAAASGRAWYVIAARKVLPVPESRPGAAETASPWVAVVLADIQEKCRPVAFYNSVDRDKLAPDLSQKLDE